MAAMDAYSTSTWRVDMLHNQSLLSATLIRSVLNAFRKMCRRAKFDLELSEDIRSSIRVPLDVLEAVASLGITLNDVSVDVDSLGTGKPGTLLPGLLKCTSSLTELTFSSSYVDIDGSELQDKVFTRDRYSLLQSVLGSAKSLRELELSFFRNEDLQSHIPITNELVVAGQHPMLQSLSLSGLAFTQVTLLNAQTSWGGRLEEVLFHGVYLSDVGGEGWLDVLRTSTLMPKLCKLKFFLQHEGTLYDPAHKIVDLRHLKKGQEPHMVNDIMQEAYSYIQRNNRGDLLAGLQEILDIGLKYY